MAKLEVRLSGRQLEQLRERAGVQLLSVSAFVRRELFGFAEPRLVSEGVEKGAGGPSGHGSTGVTPAVGLTLQPQRPSERPVLEHGPAGPLDAEAVAAAMEGQLQALKRGSEVRYRCPFADCDFHALSPKAKCPVHGRTVV